MLLQIYAKNLVTKESIFVIVSMAVTLGITLLAAKFDWGYESAFLLATGMYTILAVFAFITADSFLKRLLLFGLVAGFVELIADKWLVENIASLVYPANEPKIWCSPNYMPFAWAVVLVQVGYLGWMISTKKKMLEAMILCMIIGICFIPVFEQCAYYAEWWYYNPCKMLFNTPWYIIISEGLICFFLPAIFFTQTKSRSLLTISFGIAEGLWILVSYFIMYHLIE
jgi:uncharacterized protein DUF6989